MRIYREIFGKKLRAARKPKMTQEHLAELVGVNPASVSRWETGHDFPDDDRLPIICEALGVPLDYFEKEEQPQEKSFNLTESDFAKLIVKVKEESEKNTKSLSTVNTDTPEIERLCALIRRLPASKIATLTPIIEGLLNGNDKSKIRRG